MTAIRHQIDLTPIQSALDQPLQLVTNPETQATIRVYIAAAKPQVERAAFDLLSQAVNAVNEAAGESRVSLLYAGGTLHLQVDESQETEAEPSFDEGDLEKVTLRLPRELKEMIDVAAMRHGVSANSWYVRALSRVMARYARRAGNEGERPEGEREEGRRGRRRGAYRGRGRGGPPGDLPGPAID